MSRARSHVARSTYSRFGAVPRGNADGSQLRPLVTPGVAPSWTPDGRSIYYTHKLPEALFKMPAAGGASETVRTDKLRNLIGSDGATAYMVFERPLVDGMPGLEIHSASPETEPTHLLASVSSSRVPSWQILNPTLSRDGKWIAMALADGLSTNIWTLSTATGTWRQITDFGRPTFIARRVSWSWDGRSVPAAVAEADADIVLIDGLPTSTRR